MGDDAAGRGLWEGFGVYSESHRSHWRWLVESRWKMMGFRWVWKHGKVVGWERYGEERQCAHVGISPTQIGTFTVCLFTSGSNTARTQYQFEDV